MRFLAIDFGTKRIGYSISDKLCIIASESKTIPNDEKCIEQIIKICYENNVTNVIIGLPLNNLKESKMCNLIYEFASKLEQNDKIGGLKFEFFDETCTTKISEEILINADISRKKRKKIIDGLAAKILLQKYLDDFNFKIGRNNLK